MVKWDGKGKAANKGSITKLVPTVGNWCSVPQGPLGDGVRHIAQGYLSQVRFSGGRNRNGVWHVRYLLGLPSVKGGGESGTGTGEGLSCKAGLANLDRPYGRR